MHSIDSELQEDSVVRKFRITAAEIAKAHAESEFEKYRIVQDRLFESDFDKFLEEHAAAYGSGAHASDSP